MIVKDNFINVNEFIPNENNSKNTTLIITHGMGEYSKSYKEAAEALKEKGFNVITYDLYGHGKSFGKRGYIKKYQYYLNDLDRLVKYAYENTKNVFLIGHSMGGVITNLYASIYNNINGVIVTSSPTDYLPKLSKVRYIPKVFLNNKRSRTNFKDSKLVHENNYVVDGYDLEYIYFKLINEVLFKGIRRLKKNYKKYVTNALFIYSSSDEIVSPSNGKYIMEKIISKDKTLLVYENSYHNIFNDVEKDMLIEDISKWVIERI